MKKIFFCLLILQISFFSVKAQLTLPKALERPIEQALERSKEISNKEIELEKTERKRKAVLSKYIPRVEATAAYAYLDNRMTVDIPDVTLPITGIELFKGNTKFDTHGNVLHGGVMAKSVLFSGRQIKNGAKALTQKAKGDALLIETDKDELIVDVITSFDKLKYIHASEKLIADSERRLQKEEERVNKAIANDLAVPFDRDKIKLARIELESKKTELEESKNLLFQKLNYLTGMSAEEVKKVFYELEPLVLEEGLNLDNKQELEALESYKQGKKHILKKEKGAFWPQVAAFAGVSYSSLFNGSATLQSANLPSSLSDPHLGLNEFTIAPNWMAGVALKWEIFGGTERKHKTRIAKLDIKQLENKLEDSRDKLNLLLTQKQATYTNKWKQIELATQKEEVAKNSLTQAEKQYKHGLISINQRLEAENDYLKAGQNKTEALIDQREAALKAKIVTGKLSQKIRYK